MFGKRKMLITSQINAVIVAHRTASLLLIKRVGAMICVYVRCLISVNVSVCTFPLNKKKRNSFPHNKIQKQNITQQSYERKRQNYSTCKEKMHSLITRGTSALTLTHLPRKKIPSHLNSTSKVAPERRIWRELRVLQMIKLKAI